METVVAPHTAANYAWDNPDAGQVLVVTQMSSHATIGEFHLNVLRCHEPQTVSLQGRMQTVVAEVIRVFDV